MTRRARAWAWWVRLWERTEIIRGGIKGIIGVAVVIIGLYGIHGAFYSSKTAATNSAITLGAQRSLARVVKNNHVKSSAQNQHLADQNKIIIQQNKDLSTLLVYGVQLVATVHDAQMTNQGTITAIKNLETQVATVISELPVADAVIATTVNGLAAAEQAVCTATNVACKPIPLVP